VLANLPVTPGQEAAVFKRRKPQGPQGAETDSRFDELPEDAAPPPAAAAPRPGAFAPLNAGRPADSGLGVPPYRPVPAKEAQIMSRTPTPPVPSVPGAAVRSQQTAPVRPSAREPAESRTLIVGRGISVQGTVQDAERLVVEGTVEASMIHANELVVAPGGLVKGQIEVEDAEISGTMDGTLTARASLVVRASGRVLGTARCRRLQVEEGGQITGQIEMLTDTPRAESVRLAPEPGGEPAQRASERLQAERAPQA